MIFLDKKSYKFLKKSDNENNRNMTYTKDHIFATSFINIDEAIDYFGVPLAYAYKQGRFVACNDDGSSI